MAVALAHAITAAYGRNRRVFPTTIYYRNLTEKSQGGQRFPLRAENKAQKRGNRFHTILPCRTHPTWQAEIRYKKNRRKAIRLRFTRPNNVMWAGERIVRAAAPGLAVQRIVFLVDPRLGWPRGFSPLPDGLPTGVQHKRQHEFRQWNLRTQPCCAPSQLLVGRDGIGTAHGL